MKQELKKQIGSKIFQLRNKSGLTQDKLSEKLDITLSYLGQVERGKNLVSLELLIKIAKLFNKSIDYFIFESSEEEISEKDKTIKDISLYLSRQDEENLIKYKKLIFFMEELF